MAASISIRKWIQWLPDAPSEPTTTLVLTSANGYFVDIRILLDKLEDRESSASEECIDWAFAGTSRTSSLEASQWTMRAEDMRSYVATAEARQLDTEDSLPYHSVWTHTIDSKTEHPEAIVDEGDMRYYRALDVTLEKGTMAHPGTGRMTEYVEAWHDEPTPSVEGTPDCVVLQMHDVEKAQGMFIKVGEWMQGVARAGKHFSLVRLQWTSAVGWKVVHRLGAIQFPSTIDFTRQIAVGDEFELKSSDEHIWKWKVTEMS